MRRIKWFALAGSALAVKRHAELARSDSTYNLLCDLVHINALASFSGTPLTESPVPAPLGSLVSPPTNPNPQSLPPNQNSGKFPRNHLPLVNSFSTKMFGFFGSQLIKPSPTQSSLPDRQLTANDLREEWDKAVHRDYASKIGGRNTIVAKSKELLNQHIPDLYEYDLYRKYESIVKLVNNYAVQSPVEENRPCQNGHSKLHKLSCGHHVYSEQRAYPCGKNCEAVQTNQQSFFCLLCARHHLDDTKIKVSRRWYDLLLPIFVNTKEELAWWLRVSNDMRQVEPAYLDPHGFILLPRIHCTIAMIRAYEIRQEDQMKKAIVTLLEPVLPRHPDITIIAPEYFEHCLIFQHELDNADSRVLAAFAIRLVLCQNGILSHDPMNTLKALDILLRPKLHELYDIVVNTIYHGVARSSFSTF